jgi:hypothetical protein
MATVRWVLLLGSLAAAVSGRALVGTSSAVFDGKPVTVRQSGHSRAGSYTYEQPPPSARLIRVDLYGNQIDDAVGDYRVDWSGDIYERHAPETAVLKLPSPTL